ncbi:MAG: glycosyl hydrolase family protein, partial [Lysobacteraceae bacterium]
ITQPLDFVGINYYTRCVTRACESYPLNAGQVRQPLGTYTETGWEVYPQGLVDLLLWFKRTYGDIPLYITENGAAFFDPPVAERGRICDPLRVNYLHKHLHAIYDAISAGVDIRGYMAWSLLDNLEWSLGYSKRFGLVHVNYATQERTPKDSARWYSEVIASHGRKLSEPPPY